MPVGPFVGAAVGRGVGLDVGFGGVVEEPVGAVVRGFGPGGGVQRRVCREQEAGMGDGEGPAARGGWGEDDPSGR